MRHLLRGRTLPIAVTTGIAGTVAAAAFGLSSTGADDPAPIELEGSGAVTEPIAPVADDGGTVTEPPGATSATRPAPPPGPGTEPRAEPSDDPTPSPVSPPTPDSPPSVASPGSPASVGSIDS